jgi:hypothetical protein
MVIYKWLSIRHTSIWGPWVHLLCLLFSNWLCKDAANIETAERRMVCPYENRSCPRHAWTVRRARPIPDVRLFSYLPVSLRLIWFSVISHCLLRLLLFLTPVVTCTSDYRRGLDCWLDLLTSYTPTTRDYTLQFTVTHILVFSVCYTLH